MKFKFPIYSSFKKIKPFIVLIFIISLSGCISIKPAAEKSGKSLFETFYVGEEGTQYFIKPLTFTNYSNEEKLNIDFTFRYKNEVKDSVTVNFSLLSSNIFKSIDSFSFSNTTNKIISKNIKLLFNEKKNKLFKSRFSTKISLIEFNKMFVSNEWKITIFSPEFSSTYIADKKTKKRINKLRDNVFILLKNSDKH